MYDHMRIEKGRQIPIMNSIIRQHAEQEWEAGKAIDITPVIKLLREHGLP